MFGGGHSVLGEKKITQVTHTRVNRSHSDRRAVRRRTDRRRRSAESGCRRARGGVPAACQWWGWGARARDRDRRERDVPRGGNRGTRAATFPLPPAVRARPGRAGWARARGRAPPIRGRARVSWRRGAPAASAVATATACTAGLSLAPSAVRVRSCARVTYCRVPSERPPSRDRATVGRCRRRLPLLSSFAARADVNGYIIATLSPYRTPTAIPPTQSTRRRVFARKQSICQIDFQRPFAPLRFIIPRHAIHITEMM